MKLWIFDRSDGGPCLLRFRSGHSVPSLCIKFWCHVQYIPILANSSVMRGESCAIFTDFITSFCRLQYWIWSCKCFR